MFGAQSQQEGARGSVTDRTEEAREPRSRPPCGLSVRRPKLLRMITERCQRKGKNSSINGGQDQGESRQREEGMRVARSDRRPRRSWAGGGVESTVVRTLQGGAGGTASPTRKVRSPKGGSKTSRESREKPSPRKSARFPSGQDRETNAWRRHRDDGLRGPEGTVARPGGGRGAGPDSGPIRGDAEPLRTCVRL